MSEEDAWSGRLLHSLTAEGGNAGGWVFQIGRYSFWLAIISIAGVILELVNDCLFEYLEVREVTMRTIKTTTEEDINDINYLQPKQLGQIWQPPQWTLSIHCSSTAKLSPPQWNQLQQASGCATTSVTFSLFISESLKQIEWWKKRRLCVCLFVCVCVCAPTHALVCLCVKMDRIKFKCELLWQYQLHINSICLMPM